MKLNILVACEESQAVTMEFRKLGHNAFSCDLEEQSGGYPEYHIQGDAIKTLYSQKWDLVVAFPPCTYLANSGVRWRVERNEWEEIKQAANFFNKFIKYAKQGSVTGIENPIQHKYARNHIEKYHQIIQPYQFGHMEKKATCLWLYGLPELKSTNNVYNKMMQLSYKDRAKVHYQSPSKDRAKLRSKTYKGIAEAIAKQFSDIIINH
jgi:hypothetical protein